MKLHNEIMNISSGHGVSPVQTPSESDAYKKGHRDARHAAAEIALKGEAEIERLNYALADIANPKSGLDTKKRMSPNTSSKAQP